MESDYDPTSPAAWLIRVRRGANLLDELTLDHTWREYVYPDDLLNFDDRVLDTVSARMSGISEWTLRAYLNTRHPFASPLRDLREYGFAWEPEETPEVQRAWYDYLTTCNNALATLAS